MTIRGRTFLRTAVAASLTAYILWKTGVRELLAAGRGADWRPFALAVCLVFVDRALNAYRWVVLLRAVGPGRPPLRAIMRIFFVSTFVGTFLPASVGGEAVRAYSLARLDVRTSDAVASVLMDRMMGVASIVLMALAGLILTPHLIGGASTSPAAGRTIAVALAIAFAVCVVTLLLVFSRRGDEWAPIGIAWLPLAVQGPTRRILQSIRAYAAYRRELVNVLASSVGVQILRIVQAYYLGRAIGVPAPMSVYFAFIPVILLVMLLPVTFNGIGTSQVAFIWFFRQAGVLQPQALALSILFVALGIIGNLPGALLYAFGRGRPKHSPKLEVS